ncbi:MAG: T9SS type A sorting domain-containing protein [Bacteroidetes bacterium]|nr:T9SS type A sorting domain-containing protein [Bacteroidota bacterium]
MKKYVISLLLLLTAAMPSYSQSSDGRDFYLGLLTPSINRQTINFLGRNITGFYGVYALITSYDASVVTVGYFDDNGNEINKQTYNVLARRSVQVPLDVAHMRPDSTTGGIAYTTCHITSNRNISVTFFSTGACSGGSYLALPTPVLGTRYTVLTYHDNPNGYANGTLSNENGRSVAQVIAAYDNTTVTITPSTTTADGHIGFLTGAQSNRLDPHPYKITLNRGQAYTFYSTGTDASFDLSGTSIVANKSIAVIAGNENGFVDGGNPDPGQGKALDGRDFMIEQMLPSSALDTAGYYSIPFYRPVTQTTQFAGDSYVVTAATDTLGAVVVGTGGSVAAMGAGPYSVHQDSNVTGPVEYHSTNGQKFGVIAAEHRYQGSTSPFSSPSIMTLVPRSRWKSSYLWYVPNNTFEIMQGYYVNVICRAVDFDNDSLFVATNAGKLVSVRSSGLAVKSRYNAIPNAPDLIGLTLSVGPGSYYMTTTGSMPFMVYQYGFRAIDPDRDLGDMDGDDFFFSYAAPVGCAISDSSANMSVTVDTSCATWHVCVRDHSGLSSGIKSIQILDDAAGDFVRPGRKYYNVQFDPSVDPYVTREIDLPGTDSVYCFDVLVSNPLDSAYGPIYILDNNGNSVIVDLHYRTIKMAVMGSQGLTYRADSMVFQPTAIGSSNCVTIQYVNNGKPGDPPLQITDISLKRNDPAYYIDNTTPKLPVSLASGDTLTVDLCFRPRDTKIDEYNPPVHLDSLVLTTPCFKAPITLVGPVGVPLLYATDKDFGLVVVGNSKCDTVTVSNIGNIPITVTDTIINASLFGNKDFSWDGSSKYNKNRLPVILQPGQYVRVSFCFTPSVVGHDSASVIWQTDVTGSMRDSIKRWSALKGTGIIPGVKWDRKTQVDYVDTLAASPQSYRRVNLLGGATAPTHVQRVFFDEADSSEFHIVANKYYYQPLEGFVMNVGDTLWVDYIWAPDLTKGTYPRHAQLRATFDYPGGRLDSTVIDITGSFDSKDRDGVAMSSSADGRFTAYFIGNALVIHSGTASPSITQIVIYDVLGREVQHTAAEAIAKGDHEIVWPLPQLASGTYFVKLVADGRMYSLPINKLR